MRDGGPGNIRNHLDKIYRSESRGILATLIRLLGDFDIAEDALHDAFKAALEQWPTDGVPDKPRSWLISTGRFKAIDRLRRTARVTTSPESVLDRIAEETREPRRCHRYGCGGRPTPSDFHLLPSCDCAGIPRCAHTQRSVRTHDGRNCPRVSHDTFDSGSAHCARKGQDSRSRHFTSSANTCRSP